MIEHKFVIPECYGDTALIECLGYKKPNHQKGVGNVLNSFKKKGYAGLPVVGLIDNDKNIQPKLKNFKKLSSSNGIDFYQCDEELHYLIVLSPALEKFILKCCESIGILPSAFGLSDDFKILKNLIKDENVGSRGGYIQLINHLAQNNCGPMDTLKGYLNKAVGPPKSQHFS